MKQRSMVPKPWHHAEGLRWAVSHTRQPLHYPLLDLSTASPITLMTEVIEDRWEIDIKEATNKWEQTVCWQVRG